MKDVGTSKPKKYSNKVGRLMKDPKLNKPLPYNFGSYVNLPTLFAYFLGFDIPTSSFIFKMFTMVEWQAIEDKRLT